MRKPPFNDGDIVTLIDSTFGSSEVDFVLPNRWRVNCIWGVDPDGVYAYFLSGIDRDGAAIQPELNMKGVV